MFVKCVSIMFGASFTIFGEFTSGPVAFLGFGFYYLINLLSFCSRISNLKLEFYVVLLIFIMLL